MAKTDMQLQHDVEEELRWDPKVDCAHIGVTVDRGAVSLFGTVVTFADKMAAEDATRRVSGVRTIAQALTVKIHGDHKRDDTDIAIAVQHGLQWDVMVPKSVTAEVQCGYVTLAGQVVWNYQRAAAERAIRYITGVVGVLNNISLHSQAPTHDVKQGVQAALARQSSAEDNGIHVTASGGKVTLTGHASSWRALANASNAAWAAPGVTEVVDRVQMAMPIL